MNTIPFTAMGIWGFGTTGKAMLSFLASQGITCTIFDNRPLTAQEQDAIKAQGGIYHAKMQLDDFLKSQAYVCVSPGIDYTAYAHMTTFIAELDLFYTYWRKPIIGITGALGKTTTTTFAYRMLSNYASCLLGGNIGIATAELLLKQDDHATTWAVLELSSYQLEHCQQFRPDVAIWTNLYPNHLDRHGTMAAYTHAKAQMLAHQLPTDTIIAPYALKNIIEQYAQTERICYFMTEHYTQPELIDLPPTASLIYRHDKQIMLYANNATHPLMHIQQMPQQGFLDHWMIMLALAHQLYLKDAVTTFANVALSLEHRLEYVANQRVGTYINDSKSTTMASTVAAVQRVGTQPVTLLLGGLSKGVDRKPLFEQLKTTNIKEIICFGKEAEQLVHWAHEAGYRACAHATLTAAFRYASEHASSDDCVLLSPAGSSYDLYADYIERGNHFKLLVQSL